MKIAVIACHPNLAASRVNLAWLERLRQEQDITVHHLQTAYPNKIIDVPREQELLLSHDRIVLQYPLYWYSPPSFLKMWLEDVLETAWIMGPGGRGLAGKELVLAISTGSREDAYQAGGFQSFSMSEFAKPLQAMAGLIGIKFLPSFVFHGAAAATDEAIAVSSEDYVKHILDPCLDPRIRLMQTIQPQA